MARKRPTAIDQRVVEVLAHPTRVQALTIFSERDASPNQIAKELDKNLSNVAYHVRVLRDFKCIELVDTRQRRGATEHFYRATDRALEGSG